MNEEKRVQKLHKLKKKIEIGKKVSRAELKAALTSKEMNEFVENWEHEKSGRKSPLPNCIKRYLELARAGMLLYNRKEAMYGKREEVYKIMNMANKADDYFQLALEIACESVDQDGSMLMYFDIDPRNMLNAGAEDLPKIRNFYSTNGVKRIQDYKEIAISEALDNLNEQASPFDFKFAEPWRRAPVGKMDTSGFNFS